MALYQQFMAPTGRKFEVRLEMADEPGSPRAFWDGAAGRWTADPAGRLAAAPDPTMPGIYTFSAPTTRTAAWADRTVWATVIDVTDDPSHVIVYHAAFAMRGGDDGSRTVPSADLPLPGGMVLHAWDAYVRPAPPAAPAPTRP